MKKNSRLILSTLAMVAIASLFGAVAYISISDPELVATQSASEGPEGDGDGETNDAVESTTSNSDGPEGGGDGETSDDAKDSPSG